MFDMLTFISAVAFNSDTARLIPATADTKLPTLDNWPVDTDTLDISALENTADASKCASVIVVLIATPTISPTANASPTAITALVLFESPVTDAPARAIPLDTDIDTADPIKRALAINSVTTTELPVEVPINIACALITLDAIDVVETIPD